MCFMLAEKMRCFNFRSEEKKEVSQNMQSASAMSNSTVSTDRDMRRSGSEFNSQNISNTSSESVGRPQYPSFSSKPSNLRVFTFLELKTATRNFGRSVMIGVGGFGSVYRGSIMSSEDPNMKIEIAVKQLNRKGLQGHKEWMTEVNVLGIVDHPNLVKLIGYCADDDERGIQRLLVYEYMQNGSVLDHLSPRTSTPLSWPMRLRIALDSARGLTYLHEELEFQIIFRDFKTSNILLDENWNAKLSDFGLARQGPEEGSTHVSTAIVGTMGYAAPEYLQTGHLNAKSDIWSFGVFLYELITGRLPIDNNRPKAEQKLLEWVKPYITDVKKFRMIIDPRLETRKSLKSMTKLSTVANRCLVGKPRSRPKMSEVVEMIQKIMAGSDLGSPKPPLLIVNVGNKKEEKAEEGRKGLNLKRGSDALKEGRRLVWRGWTPKLVKTCQ